MPGAVEKATPGQTPDQRSRANIATGRRIDPCRVAGRPRRLPLEMRLEDLGLSLEALRASLGSERSFGNPLKENDPAEHRLGFFNPPIGRLVGAALSRRIGALVSRPGCAFSNSFLWRYDHGSEMNLHVDRAPLDITMSVPITLDGVDAWPVRVRQPEGDVIEWPSRPGTALVFDGRWRQHWRGVFRGRCAMVLLLHWRAPAVLWPRFLDDDQRRRLRDGPRRRADVPVLLESSTALARSAVPQTMPLDLEVVDLRGPNVPEAGRGVVLLAPLRNELALTFDRTECVLAPGDGVAFAAHDECRLDWRSGDGANTVLLGRGRRP